MTFETIKEKKLIASHFYSHPMLFWLCDCCKKNDPRKLLGKRMRINTIPPHPSNIEWKNVGTSKKTKLFYRILSILFSILLIVLVFTILYVSERASNIF